jgi:hypothetical protein
MAQKINRQHADSAVTFRSPRRPDRADKHVVAAHLETDAYRQFKRLGADQLKTTDAMVNEAIALLFKKYRRPIPTPISRKLKKLGIAE